MVGGSTQRLSVVFDQEGEEERGVGLGDEVFSVGRVDGGVCGGVVVAVEEEAADEAEEPAAKRARPAQPEVDYEALVAELPTYSIQAKRQDETAMVFRDGEDP